MTNELIPDDLKKLDQWVNWGANIKSPKIPFNPVTLTPAKAGQPDTWGTFLQAEANVQIGKAIGVGFQFHNNRFVGVDLDTVRNPATGKVSDEAIEIINTLDSYTEVSPSGYGFHIFVKADISLEFHKAKLVSPSIVARVDENNQAKLPEIEIYKERRYFTVTGNVHGVLTPIEERTEQLQAVYDKYLKKPPVEHESSAKLPINIVSSEGYFQSGLNRDNYFRRLWNGYRPSGNESSDDLALLNKLAFWCNKNADDMINKFIDSPYYEQKDEKQMKKCDREDYLPRTAQVAIDGTYSTAAANDMAYQAKTALSTAAKADSNQGSPDSKSTTEASKLDVVCLADIAPQSVEWIWHPYIPLGKRVIVQGDPGQGKTMLLLKIASTLSKGDSFFDDDPFIKREPARIVYQTAEDGLADTIVPRLSAMGANFNNIFVINEDEQSLTLSDSRIEQVLIEKQPALFIIDPFQAYLGKGVNMNLPMRFARC